MDNGIAKFISTKLFLEAQGQKITLNIIYQDNQSWMKLEANGKASFGKHTWHYNIKYFYITDLIKRNEVSIEYCATDAMIADYKTKLQVGLKFTRFRQQISRQQIMNLTWKISGQQECVGKWFSHLHYMRWVALIEWPPQNNKKQTYKQVRYHSFNKSLRIYLPMIPY